jgi:Tfp pilus assembly protein PilO
VSAPSSRLKVTRRSVVVVLAAVAILVAWLLAYYLPESHKLDRLDRQQISLQSTEAADEARLAQVKKEAHHVGQIDAMYQHLEGYVPATEELYTYIHTIAAAAKTAGVTITSLNPSALEPVPDTSYSAVPISASIKGTFDNLLAFLKALYSLPRLTDVNSVSVSGGGPGTNRGVTLTVGLQLAIFTSQKPASSG